MLPYISMPFKWLSAQLGASPDELKLIATFLASYPLAGLLKRIPDGRPDQKILFSTSISMFYLVGLFDMWDGLRTILVSSLAVYSTAKFLRGSPFMPWIGFIIVMGHLSVNQLARQFRNDPSIIDITGAQMVLVMKLSAFCWNVADGTLPDDQLSPLQRERRIKTLPTVFDFLGYVFFFPSLLVGPAFDYMEYKHYLDCTMFEVSLTVEPSKKPPTRKKRKIPRSAIPAMKTGLFGLIWIGSFLQLSRFFSPDVLLSEYYDRTNFFNRVLIMHMVGLTARTKFYGVWSMAEGACILAGIGFNGVDPKTGRVSWDRVRNINPVGVELAQNTRGYLANWNMNTNAWLRNYVYLRVTPRGKKPGFRASLITFSTSAFWHGFYPGYYLSFVLASFVQTSAKNFRRYIRPFFLSPLADKVMSATEKQQQRPLKTKIYYDILSLLATQLTFTFVAVPFLLLDLKNSLQAWKSVYLYAVIGTALTMAFFSSPAKGMLKKKISEREARAKGEARPGERLVRSRSTDSLTGGDRMPVLGVADDVERELDQAKVEFQQDLAELKRVVEKSGGIKEEGMRLAALARENAKGAS